MTKPLLPTGRTTLSPTPAFDTMALTSAVGASCFSCTSRRTPPLNSMPNRSPRISIAAKANTVTPPSNITDHRLYFMKGYMVI